MIALSCTPTLYPQPVQAADLQAEACARDDTLLFPEAMRHLLCEAVNHVMTNHPEEFLSPDAFVRKSKKLSPVRLIDFIFSLQASNLPIQIASFCGYDPDCQFANSTLSEARNKIDADLFREMFDYINMELVKRGAFNEKNFLHPVYAIDGSVLHLEPFCKNEEYFAKTKSKNRRRAGAHLVALYNVDNKLFTDCEVQKLKGKNERKGALNLIAKIEEESIFVMDRGFHSFVLENKIQQMGHYYLIRLKKRDFYSLLQIKEDADIDPEIDIHKNLILTSSKKVSNKGDALHHFCHKKSSEILDENGECKFSFRLLKIDMGVGLADPDKLEERYQYFITNLPEEEYTLENIRAIYDSRWSVEKAFLELKYYVGLQAIHARKINGVYQETWARLILHNLISACIMACERNRPAPKRPPKHETRINRKFAIEILRKFLNYEILDEEYVVREIWRHTTPVKPERYFERHTLRKLDSNQHRMI